MLGDAWGSLGTLWCACGRLGLLGTPRDACARLGMARHALARLTSLGTLGDAWERPGTPENAWRHELLTPTTRQLVSIGLQDTYKRR
jgi:hypothetical protein